MIDFNLSGGHLPDCPGWLGTGRCDCSGPLEEWFTERQDTMKLKGVEGNNAGKEYEGSHLAPPEKGKSYHFVHNDGKKILTTSPVREVTEKKERTIIRTENSVYSLEKQ